MILRCKNNMTLHIRHIISHVGTATNRLRRTLTLLCLMMTLGAGSLWGQTDFSGVWYIANLTNHSNENVSTHWYLVPGANPQQAHYADAYFNDQYCNTSGSGDYTGDNYGDPGKPFLTTYQTSQDLNSIWIIASTGDGYYNIIHAKTGKYVVYEPPYKEAQHRKSMHLESTANPGDNAKFTISGNSLNGPININPKSVTSGNMYFNPAVGEGNRPQYYGTGSPYFQEGMIGLYNNPGDKSQWYLEDASSAAALTPTISNADETNNTFTITSPAAAFSTIRYTTDGSTTPDASTGSTATSGNDINIADIWSVQAVGVFGTFATPVAGPKNLSPSQCATPVISYDYTTSQATITCATASTTIYYTTNGVDPTSGSTEYSEPITVTNVTTIKAIAIRNNFPDSEVATLVIGLVATPTIQNNGSNAISITTATPGATIYYTTNGDTPTPSSTEYTTPLQENVSSVTIRAIAVKENMIMSAVGSGSVTLQCATPVISRDGLTFTISCSLPSDANIYYRLDGGAEVQYQGTPVSFTSEQLPMTVTAVARHNSYTQSETATRELKNGTGTESDPYLIYGTTDFTHFVNDVNSGSTASAFYRLGKDISASGISAITTDFTGTFDGGSFTITDLDHPLFSTIDGAVVKNVTLKNVNISSSLDTLGAIACIAKGYSRIYNCGILPNSYTFPAQGTHPSVSTTGNCAGGLVGSLRNDSRVINCYSYADVNASNTASGIVGRNTFASTAAVTDGKYTQLRTAVVNCMFYGDITGGADRWPVYGGEKIVNNTATGINNYDYYRAEASLGLTDDNHYNCSWPAQEEYLTHYEFYRNLLNSNRELCGWWVGAASAPANMTTTQVQEVPKDATLMAKWVLDPTIAPYPILKPFGKYTSPVNIDADASWRASANEWQGKKLGTLSVTINPGTHAANGINTTSATDYIITDMDTLHGDYCFRKVQLPYYNSVFGNPNGATWEEKYGGNYGDYVVTGWEITSTDGAAGTFINSGNNAWQDGYNFADRNCSDKDKYSESGRIFAQGGYYYVPDDVTEITITAHWATAIYLDNTDHYYDRVSVSSYVTDGGASVGTSTLSPFEPAGTRSTTLDNGKTLQNGSISSNIPSGGSVYGNAIVLVGNHQYFTGGSDVKGANNTDGCTIMSADFDFDNEPDNCLIWQLGTKVTRQSFAPIRFDFLPILEMGLAMKEDGSTQYYSLGCYRPLGHFEITETSLIHFGQFEFSNKNRGANSYAPIILNGGIFDQYTKGTRNNAFSTADDKINYIIIGGNVRMPSFTPGAHVNDNANYPTRHCAVNIIGGNIDYVYLTGNYNNKITPNTDNPHCYIDGGRIKQVAAAGKEGINGDVYFFINHSKIWEFYGGSTLSDQLVTGNINVTISNSIVNKYCGGPKFGDMNLDENNPDNSKTVTTNATGTTFGVYYGGGNGGTSYVQYDKTDGEQTVSSNFNWGGTGKLDNYVAGKYRDVTTGYMADYDMEIVNLSTGTNRNRAVYRTYFHAAQFSATNTGSITNNLTDCTVLTNFYGAGNLGGVKGNVTSTLTNTRVYGSAFGAGYSATVPDVTIHNKNKTVPTINVYTGIVTPQSGGDGTTYTWTNETSLGGQTLSTSSPAVTNVTIGGVTKNYYYTTVPLVNLGAVSGLVRLTITGSGQKSSVIGTEGDDTTGNVYGGGDMSKVINTANPANASTIVTLSGNTEIKGSVFGGGNQGDVSGSTQVIIE